jgi:hypothetical protein
MPQQAANVAQHDARAFAAPTGAAAKAAVLDIIRTAAVTYNFFMVVSEVMSCCSLPIRSWRRVGRPDVASRQTKFVHDRWCQFDDVDRFKESGFWHNDCARRHTRDGAIMGLTHVGAIRLHRHRRGGTDHRTRAGNRSGRCAKRKHERQNGDDQSEKGGLSAQNVFLCLLLRGPQ